MRRDHRHDGSGAHRLQRRRPVPVPSVPSRTSTPAGRSASTPSAIAYSGCMRAHGVPNFPDPDNSGNLRAVGPQQLGVSTSLYQAAEQTCRRALPTGGLAATTDPAVPAGRRLSARPGAATADRRAKVRPVPALQWDTELAGPDDQRQGWSAGLRPQWRRPRLAFGGLFQGFVAVRCQRSSVPRPGRGHGADPALHVRCVDEADRDYGSAAPTQPARARRRRGGSRGLAAAAATRRLRPVHRARQRRRARLQRLPIRSACAHTECRISPTRTAADSSPRPTPSTSGSAAPSCRRPSKPARRLLPNDSGVINAGSIDQCMKAGDCPRALVRHVLAEERSFSGCMRSHGVPNWPDPSIDSAGTSGLRDKHQQARLRSVLGAGLGQGQPVLAPDARAARAAGGGLAMNGSTRSATGDVASRQLRSSTAVSPSPVAVGDRGPGAGVDRGWCSGGCQSRVRRGRAARRAAMGRRLRWRR